MGCPPQSVQIAAEVPEVFWAVDVRVPQSLWVSALQSWEEFQGLLGGLREAFVVLGGICGSGRGFGGLLGNCEGAIGVLAGMCSLENILENELAGGSWDILGVSGMIREGTTLGTTGIMLGVTGSNWE